MRLSPVNRQVIRPSDRVIRVAARKRTAVLPGLNDVPFRTIVFRIAYEWEHSAA